MDINQIVAENVREFRRIRELSQEELAELANVDRTYISKVERGDRNTTATTIQKIAYGLNIPPHLLLVENYLHTNIGKMEVDLSGLAEIANNNPSLRSFIVGYQAEYMARKEIKRQLGITEFRKYDDHDRSKHGDIWFEYKGREYSVEVKRIQTNSVKHVEGTDEWEGKFQCDGSDASDITLPNGRTVHTVAYPFGLFDIVAVGLFAFGDKWRFAFIKSCDLEPANPARNRSLPADCCQYFIKTMQSISLPLKAPYTFKISELL